MGDSFIELFDGMSITAFMCISLGLMFVIIEFFQTTNGIVAFLGGALIASGTVMRMLAGGTLGVLFWMVFLVSVVLFAAHTVALITQKRNWLVQSLTLAINENPMAARGAGYGYLKNLTGVATTDISLTGHVSINDVNFFVSSKTPIEKGTVVRVVDADGESIVVEPLFTIEEV